MNILAVDDEKDTRLFLRDLLTELGHRVVTAASAHEAKALLDRESVDVVLLDLMMPGTDGFQFARYLRENWPTARIPFIVLSCRKDEESKCCARGFGCSRYLDKPFVPSDLINALEDIARGDQEDALLGS